VLAPPAIAESSYIVGDRCVQVEPHGKVKLIVRHGPTLGEWVERGDEAQIVSISASSSPDGPTQAWRLSLVGSLLQQCPATTPATGHWLTIPPRWRSSPCLGAIPALPGRSERSRLLRPPM
jgi:hypothetical protein